MVPRDEDQESNQARNIMFELILAENYGGQVYTPHWASTPTYSALCTAHLCLSSVSASCPRGRSAHASARPASNSRSSAYTTARAGIVAVSLSKTRMATLTKTGTHSDTFLRYSDERKAPAFLGDELEQLAQQVRKSPVMRRLPTNMIGMLWHLMTPAQHEETALTVLAEQLKLEVLAADETADYRTVQTLYVAVASVLTSHPGHTPWPCVAW